MAKKTESLRPFRLGVKLSIRPDREEWQSLSRCSADFVEWSPGVLFPGPSAQERSLLRRLRDRELALFLRLGIRGNPELNEVEEGVQSWLEETRASGLLLAASSALDESKWERLRDIAPGRAVLFDRAAKCPLRPGWVPDPAWDRTIRPGNADYWKVHGWHPERWVRRYGETELRRIARRALTLGPSQLCLAHSGRFEEFELLRTFLA